MRFGIATGAAFAGVIGESRFAYDLWSDTVNTASRLEATAPPGRIHVDQATADALRPSFVLVERGIVSLKGKDPTRTWFLERFDSDHKDGTRTSTNADI